MSESNVMYVNLSPEVNRFVRSQASLARLPLTAVLDALLREAIAPPPPIFSSTLWTIVPGGMLRSGIALPGFTSTRSPETTVSPGRSRCGARM